MLFSCDNNDDTDLIPEAKTESTIVETAQATEALNSLVAALTNADEKADTDLIGTLSGSRPFTVFAPTNEAFANPLTELGENYNSLADFDTVAEKELLATILTYHVSSGSILNPVIWSSTKKFLQYKGKLW